MLKKQANNLKWDKKVSIVQVAYLLNEQFTYLERIGFWKPTLNSHFKFLKRFRIFYFCRNSFNAIPFSTWYNTVTFRVIPQIIMYMSKFENTFRQF